MDYEVKQGNLHQFVFSEEQKEAIKDMYTSQHMTANEICKLFNVCPSTISRLLVKMGVKQIKHTDSLEPRGKYNLDVTYFDSIDTPNKAYILGFLFADGHNQIDRQTIMVSVQEEDRQLLEDIRTELKSTKPLEYIDYSNKHDGGYNYKNQYRLSIFNYHMSQSLNKLGMIHDKSLKLEFPDIPEELYPHFIRGYYDGDGSLCTHVNGEGKFQPLITFTSTQQFCEAIQKILIDNLGIRGGNIYDASCHNGITRVLSISGAVQVKEILDWLYQDADMFLERKNQKFRDSFYLIA